MTAISTTRAMARWLSMGAGVAEAAYAGYAAVTWLRYGHASTSSPQDEDVLLDRFMPAYDIAERHHIRVAAPAATTLNAACETDLLQSLIDPRIRRA